MRRAACLPALLFLSLAACDDGGGDDLPLVIDATDSPSASVIDSCTDIDATGLNSANIDTFVAAYHGRPCTQPLEGGITGLLQECQYGDYLWVCGQSSGLSQFGCSCSGGALHCSNGEEIKRQQERLCGDGGMD